MNINKTSYICILLSLIVLPFCFASSNWDELAKSGDRTNSIVGSYWGLNQSELVHLGISSDEEPIIWDLSGTGTRNILIINNSQLRVYDNNLLLRDYVTIPNLLQKTPTLVSGAVCGSPSQRGIGLHTNPSMGGFNASFQIWCYNGSKLYKNQEVIIVYNGTSEVNADYGSGIACDPQDCVFTTKVNNTVILSICNTGSGTVSCSNYNASSSYSVATFYYTPTISDMLKGYSGSEIILYSDYINNGNLGFSFYQKSGNELLGFFGLPQSLRILPYFQVMERSVGDNYIVWFYTSSISHYFHVYDMSANIIFSSPTGVNFHSQTFSNFVKVDSDKYCIMRALDWELVYYNSLFCYTSSGIMTNFGDISEYIIPQYVYPITPSGVKATGVDVNNDGNIDFRIQNVSFDVSQIGINNVSLITYSGTAEGNYRYAQIPADINQDDIIDYLSLHDGLTLYLGSYAGYNYSNASICTDTDSVLYPSINYTLRGTASYLGSVGTDYCSGNILTEFFCSNQYNLMFTTAQCGYGCLNGACVTCLEVWSCSEYSDCVANQQQRVCIDLSGCGTTFIKPPINQSCQAAAQGNIINFPMFPVNPDNPTSLTGGFLPEIFMGLISVFEIIVLPLAIIVFLVVFVLFVTRFSGLLRG